jgi:hypothetical protein
MGDQHQNTASTPEELAIERAEQRLSDPSAQNMQFLQSSVGEIPSGVGQPLSPLPDGIQRMGSGAPSSSNPGSTAYHSGAGLFGAVAAADLASAGSAMGVAAQVASAAPSAFGKDGVSPAVELTQTSFVKTTAVETVSNDVPAARATVNQPYVPTAQEFQHLQNLIESNAGSDISNEALMSLLGAPGQEPDAASLQAAIDAVTDQLALLNDTFSAVFDGLDVDVAANRATLSDLSSTDLGVTILSDASSVSASLNDLLGTSNLSANPQLGSLLNLGSTVDDVVSLVGSLPDLDPTPPGSNLTIEPIVEPIVEPITDIVGGVLDPITEPIVEPIVEPVIDGVDGILPGLGVLSGTVSTEPEPDGDSGLLGSITTGISSNASGSEANTTGLHGGDLDPTK